MVLSIISIINLFRIILILLISVILYPFVKDKSIYLFLRFCGPTFIKLGQLLSSRPDLVGDNLAAKLAVFQDKLPPFSYKQAKRIIESESKVKINKLFLEFCKTPVASASIAQVHKAKTYDGKLVAVKILRPRIRQLVFRDIATLKLLSFIVSIFSSYGKKKIDNIVSLLKMSATRELDLLQEASVASQLKENSQNFEGFYVPEVYWNMTFGKIMTMEWIDGIAFSNKKAIDESGFNKEQIAKNLVISYFNQVYTFGFFHADMHPGNLFLMKNGDIAVVDFGIVGIIDKKTRIAVAEILIGFLQRDYKKVAKVHVESNLVPENTNIEELALTCRIIGESVVDLSVKQISLAKLMERLLKMAKKHNMDMRPELLLLQKTMMLVEGVGASLNKDLNMWELSAPWIKQWAIKNIGFDAKIRDNMIELITVIKKIPDILDKKLN